MSVDDTEREIAELNIQIRRLTWRRNELLGDLAEEDLNHINDWRGGRIVPDKPLEELPENGRPESNTINDIKEA